MKRIVLAAAFFAATLAPVAAQPPPSHVTIEYGDHEFTIDGNEPLVSCIVAQRADLDGRYATLAVWVRNVNGVYDLVSEKETRQTGAIAGLGVGDCVTLEG